MSEENIVLRKFRNKKTGEEFDIKTPFFETIVKVPTLVNVPLYEDGELISDTQLSKLGLEIVGYTQDQLDETYYGGLYAANPDLANRVRQYKNYLDGLSLPYSATTDEIDAALQAREELDTAGRLELAARIRNAFQDIVVNLEACGSMTASFEAWQTMPKLVKYLPALPEPKPVPDQETHQDAAESGPEEGQAQQPANEKADGEGAQEGE